MAAEHSAGKRAKELNDTISYTVWSVFKVRTSLPTDGREAMAEELGALVEQLDEKGIQTRGLYDVAGFRADADIMIWWVAPTSDDLQEAWSRFRSSSLGRSCEPVWSAMALHRPAEFN